MQSRPTGSNITKVLLALIKYGAFVLIVYYCNDSIKEMAGKITMADINVDFWNETLAAVFGGGGVYYGSQQRKLRKNTVERLTKRNTILEQYIDTNRSSSGLTPLGNTDPEDL